MKHREGDPWQALFKEQPLGAREGWEGPEPGSMLGDWSDPSSKAKCRKPSQKRRPCRMCSHPRLWSSLQNLSCFAAWINMRSFYLQKLLFLPFSQLSFLLQEELKAALPQMETWSLRSRNPSFFLSPLHFPHFCLLFGRFFFGCFSFERLLSSAPVGLAWCVAPTDVSFEIEISSCSAKWLT